MPRLATLAAIGLLAFVVVACADDGDEPTVQPDPPADEDADDLPDDDAPDDDAPDDDPGEGDGDPPDDGRDDGASTALLDEQVQAAIDDAVERMDVARDEVTVVTTELVTWPDGSIGCPDPDQMYTQALVDGYRIVLEVDGEALAYHGAEGSPPAYCDDPQEPVGGNGRATG